MIFEKRIVKFSKRKFVTLIIFLSFIIIISLLQLFLMWFGKGLTFSLFLINSTTIVDNALKINGTIILGLSIFLALVFWYFFYVNYKNKMILKFMLWPTIITIIMFLIYFLVPSLVPINFAVPIIYLFASIIYSIIL